MDEATNGVTDDVFESGHCDCQSGQVSIVMCADSARMAALILTDTARQWDSIDPEVAYYMRAFAADIEVQIDRQANDFDTVPSDW